MAQDNAPVTTKKFVFILVVALILLAFVGELRLRALIAFLNFKFAGV